MSSSGNSGAASRSELGWLARRVSSAMGRSFISPRRARWERRLRELARRLRGEPHRVHYFHQVDDPYSHLAAQALDPLSSAYEIEWVPHVVSAETGPNLPEPVLLAALARRDCSAIAPHYGLAFDAVPGVPEPARIALAERALVAAARDGAKAFADAAPGVGRALWTGKPLPRMELASETEARAALAASTLERRRLGHYSSATFYYAGEWYWGVDRLYHLERRWISLGLERGPSVRFPRPCIDSAPVPRAAELRLEVFPSLRSPYTAISFERVVDLAERTGVALEVRPVLPMVMRGVPNTLTKGRYIMRDAHREAETQGMPFGRMLDPIGAPVRRGYSLWPWARAQGRGTELLASFLRAVFAEGIDAGTDGGLRRIVERAGLSWSEARGHLGDPAWEEELEANRVAMVEELGQWGVPSFRLRGPDDEPDFCCWGQDRLWLLAAEIQRRGR